MSMFWCSGQLLYPLLSVVPEYSRIVLMYLPNLVLVLTYAIVLEEIE